MKKLLLSLFMVVVAIGVAKAETVTFDLSTGYENSETVSDVKLGSVTLAFAKGANTNNAPAWYTAGAAVRMYAKNVVEISTTSTTEVIQSVTFTFSSKSNTFLTGNAAEPTVSAGTYSEDGATTGTWVGTAQAFTLTAGGTKGHARISKIEVVLAPADGVLAPAFSLVEGTYYEPQEITLSCATDGAAIYYTINGDEPTTASTVYGNPIKIETTTTIKAMASKDGKNSDVVSATYTITAPIAVTNIAAFNELAKDAVIKFTNPVNVIYQNGLYLFVQDATGAMQVYGNVGQTYKSGDVIPAGFMGTVGEYGGLKQLTPMADTFVAGTSGVAITPDVVATDGVVEALVNKLIKVANVTITLDEGKTKNYTITDAKGTAAVYDRFTGVVIPKDEKKYDVTAIVNIYNGTVQLFPTEITESQNVGITGTESDNAIATVFAGDKAIKIDAAESAQVLVVNTVGQVVASKTIAAGANTVEVPAGLYLVKVNNAVTKVIIK